MPVTQHQGRVVTSNNGQIRPTGIVKGEAIEPTPLWRIVIIASVVMAASFLLFGAYLGSTPDGKARAEARAAIEYCGQNYKRLKEDPRLTRDALGIAYGACEQMKADFRRKWNREP